LLGLNSGGYVSHIGGYILGYYYAKKLADGTDIGRGFERMMDSFSNMFKRNTKSKSKMKTVHKQKYKTKVSKADLDKSASQKQIDAILDKISKSGYESLTAKEKEFLFKQGK